MRCVVMCDEDDFMIDDDDADGDFVEIDADELTEWMPNESDDSDSDMSFSDVLDMEEPDTDTSDDENSFVSSSSVQMNSGDRKKLSDLKTDGYGAVSLYRQLVKNGDSLTELEQSIQALISLVNRYGDPEALDELINLMGELDVDLAESQLGVIEEYLVDFAGSDVIHIEDSSLAESPEQLTIELQQQLVHALSLSMPGPKSALGRIFSAFADNSNFADDPQVQSLAYEFSKSN
jgi:hypothetical protein